MARTDDERLYSDSKRFWLAPPRGKYSTWGICWSEKPTGSEKFQTRRVSTGEADRSKAYLKLIQWERDHPPLTSRPTDTATHRAVAALLAPAALATTAQEIEAASQEERAPITLSTAARDMPLMAVMTNYYATHAGMASIDRVRDAMRDALEVWGDPMCSELGPATQHAFVANRRKLQAADGTRRQSDWTILTRMKCIWAAMNEHVNRGVLARAAVPEMVPGNKWLPKGHFPRRMVKLSLDELAKLFEVAASRERWWRWLIIECATAARPMAAAGLEPSQIDLESGSVHLLATEKEGVQSKKVYATVRGCRTFLGWLAQWNAEVAARPAHHDRQYSVYLGHRFTNPKFFMEIARRAGIKVPKKVGAYILRHTILSWLANNGCPTEQRLVFGGHEIDDTSGAGYVHLEPGYLQEAAEVIEKLFRTLAPLVKNRSLLTPECTSPPVPKTVPEAFSVDQPEPHLLALRLFEKFEMAAWKLTSAWHERGMTLESFLTNPHLARNLLLADKDCPNE